MEYRIGVDVGGTFTDFLLTDVQGGKRIYKSLTTPEDPAVGFFKGIEAIAEDVGLTTRALLKSTNAIIHGTTITTNAVLTGTGSKTSFVTTKGFRDVLNMRRGLKERQYDFKYSPPPVLVARHDVQVVNERVNSRGEVVVPLVDTEARRVVDEVKESKAESVAVSLLFSFLEPKHEQMIGRLLKEWYPDAYVSLSSEVLPQIRAYERHSTTVLNAYVGPKLSSYLDVLQQRLAEQGYEGVLLIMQSNGGVMSPQVAQRFAANTLMSGPAGGPTAGLFYAGAAGLSSFITVDMGGTSFDACLVVDNKPAITTEGNVGGHQIAFPMINVHTVGAGGGSIAWIDDGGMLQVGPQSAGADPGPVCYDAGGLEPTVTDADLLLGYLDPNFFFGGDLRLNEEKARQAVEQKVAEPLGLSVVEAADGIYRTINAKMADALRVVSVAKGYDPREFALIVAGGAGPIHAGMIAKEMEIPTVIIPRESSVFCAAGMLFSDLRHDYVRTYADPLEKLDLPAVSALYKEMDGIARETLAAEQIPDDRVSALSSADIRYAGQHNEVEVPIFASESLTEESLGQIAEDFHAIHNQRYGYSLPGAELELVNLRISGYGKTEKPAFEKQPKSSEGVEHALKGYRDAYFNGQFLRTPIYDGLALVNGHCVDGPCVIEQPTTTIIVPPEYALGCDEYNSYVMFHLELAPKDILSKYGRA